MPSLPELEVYKRELGRELLGQKVEHIEPLDYRVVRADPKLFEEHVLGHALRNIGRYGKWIWFDFGADEQLVFHLALTGKLKLIGPDEKRPRYSCFELRFENGRRLIMSDARKLGRIYWRKFDDLKAEKKLGLDLLGLNRDYFMASLRRRRKALKDALMDQHVIAGIGGKYADEMLWHARLHPNTKLDSLDESQIAKLYDLSQSITNTAIELGADVERFPDDWLIPHRRTDKRCPRCGGPITERTMGASETFYCPHCQPAPMPFRSG